MNIHSKFLVHWSGRDISRKKPLKLTSSEMQSFVKRLRDIIQYGLKMSFGEETIYGKSQTWVKIKTARVCFTEIKLSQAQKHAEEYGLLGIALSRKFVLERYGNPVFYVQNGDRGIVVENIDIVRGSLENNRELKKALEVVLAFFKNMSDKNKDALKYYDEMEWRIVHSDLLEREGYIKRSLDGSNFFLRLRPDHIKAIIFPNHKTKKNALEDEWLKKYFFRKKIPMITTVLDCKNF